MVIEVSDQNEIVEKSEPKNSLWRFVVTKAVRNQLRLTQTKQNIRKFIRVLNKQNLTNPTKKMLTLTLTAAKFNDGFMDFLHFIDSLLPYFMQSIYNTLVVLLHIHPLWTSNVMREKVYTRDPYTHHIYTSSLNSFFNLLFCINPIASEKCILRSYLVIIQPHVVRFSLVGVGLFFFFLSLF